MHYAFLIIILKYNYNILYRNQFKITQAEYLQEQFEKYILRNPNLRDYKPRLWNFRLNDLFESFDAFIHRLNCIKV